MRFAMSCAILDDLPKINFCISNKKQKNNFHWPLLVEWKGDYETFTNIQKYRSDQVDPIQLSKG